MPTAPYNHSQVRQKYLAGFRLYAIPGVRREKRQRRSGSERDEFPCPGEVAGARRPHHAGFS